MFLRKLDLLVKDFYFKENDLGDIGKFTAKENVDNIIITLDHCYADKNKQEYWNQNYVKTQDCLFENKEITTFPLIQLKLGYCQGEVLPGQMINTTFFTASSVFTKTDHFSNSRKYSESDDFTRSNDFTNSKGFTSSSVFTDSLTFTPSHYFNATDYFTASHTFTRSSKF